MKQYIKKETRLADFDPCPRFIWDEGLSSLAISVYTLLLQLLTELLEKKYDVISGDIPEDIVETFVDQIVVHDDYFEWRLRTSTEPVLCKVEGKEKDNTIIFLENDSHKVATQYRQLSPKCRGLNTR